MQKDTVQTLAEPINWTRGIVLPRWLGHGLASGILQLAGTIVLLVLVPSNAARALLLVGWWALTFGRLSGLEWITLS